MGKPTPNSKIQYKPVTPWEKAKHAKPQKHAVTDPADSDGMDVDEPMQQLIEDYPENATAAAVKKNPHLHKPMKKGAGKRKERGAMLKDKLEAKAAKLDERRLSKLKRKTLWE